MSFHYYPEFSRKISQDKKLMIPKKFVEKYWNRILNPIVLRFPNGVEQKIFWEESNGDIWFKKNWKNFAKSLNSGNILTFKYTGGSYFKVKIFGKNSLEKNYSKIKSLVDKEESEDESYGESEHESEYASTEDIEEGSDDEAESEEGSNHDESDDAIIDLVSDSSNIGGIDENPFFEVTMTKSYVDGHNLYLPSKFSREHLNNFKGKARLQVGEDRAMEVNLNFDGKGSKRSIICGGWKKFRKKYNLQVEDTCKFVMIQHEPLLFNVIINEP